MLKSPDEHGFRPGQPLHEYCLSQIKLRLSLAKRHAQLRFNSYDQANSLFLNYADPYEVDEQGTQVNPYPRSIVVPFSWAAAQTLIFYWFASYTSRDVLISLTSDDPALDKAAQAAEAVLQNKLNQDMFELKLFQWIHDATKFSQGRIHSIWQTEHEEVVESFIRPLMTFAGLGMANAKVERTRWKLSKEGIFTTNIDPYSYLPDPRVSSVDPQKGEFVAFENYVSWIHLRDTAEDNDYFNLFSFPSKESGISAFSSRRTTSDREYDISREVVDSDDMGYTRQSVMYIRLIPSEWKIRGHALGESTHSEIWQFAVANEEVIIQAKPYTGSGGEFPICVMDTNYDSHNLFNISDIEVVKDIQNGMDWFYNARLANLRQGLYHAIVYDPDLVEEEDVHTVEPGIRIRVRSSEKPLNQLIYQLPFQDVTRSFQNEIVQGGQFVQLGTGANDIFQGQHQKGADTLGENSMLMARAQNRAGGRCRIMWLQGMFPFGRHCLIDMQENLSGTKYYKLIGDSAAALSDLERRIQISPDMIQGELSIVPADITMPEHRDKLMMLWKEMFVFIMKDPQIAQQYDHNEIFEEFARLGGLRDVKRFKKQNPNDQLQQMMQMQQQQRPVRTQIMPDEQVMDQVQKGNLRPVNGTGSGEEEMLSQLMGGGNGGT